MPSIKTTNSRKSVKKLEVENHRQVSEKNEYQRESTNSEISLEITNSPVRSECENSTVESEVPQDFNGDLAKLLQRFTADMNKTMQVKRKKLQEFTRESTRSTAKKVLETNKNHSTKRLMLVDKFYKQFNSMIQQGESELEKARNAEDRLQKRLTQLQKHQHQVGASHAHRMKSLREMSAEFCQGMNMLEEEHVQQYSIMHNELREEMALLQKKILMETQQQEMLNVRKHLKQMLT